MPKSESRKLLESYLDDKQKHDLKTYGHIWVIARSGRVFQLKDGMSIVWWRVDRYGTPYEDTSFHVWAVDPYNLDRMSDVYLSLLTQLLFLSSDRPNGMLDIACNGGMHWHDSRGIPEMKGDRAMLKELPSANQ